MHSTLVEQRHVEGGGSRRLVLQSPGAPPVGLGGLGG
jgi:hypothetical protein